MTRTLLLALLAAAPAVATPLPDEERNRLAFLERYGEWTVRDGGATYTRLGDAVRMRLSGPRHSIWERGPVPPDLPQLLRDVDGDFTASVRVTCDPQLPPDHREWWVSGGLIVHSRSETYSARLVVGQMIVQPPGVLTERIVHRVGCWTRGHQPKGVSTRVVLRLERRGKNVTTAWSSDGEKWETDGPSEYNWPDKTRVGIVAENITHRRAEITFDHFTLTQPKK